MKIFFFTLIILLISSILLSCTKSKDVQPVLSSNTVNTTTSNTTKKDSAITVNPTLFVGNWQVVNDTTTIVPWGLWAGKPSSGQNYVGKPTDYYKFTADGHAYINISGNIDTGNYVISGNQVHIIYTYYSGQETPGGIYNSTWLVNNLTDHTATLTVTFISPETAATSVTSLKK